MRAWRGNEREARAGRSFATNRAWSRRQFLATISSAAAASCLPFDWRADGGESEAIFSDVTREAGMSWRQFNGFSPDRYLIETMGGGAGFFDFDDDGWLDIFLLNGGETPRGKSPTPLANALYRNLGNGKFVDCAAEAGVGQVKNYGMGLAIADFDNDGHQDIFATGFPNCTLYHNNGDGTFQDVTADAGLQNAGKWAAGAAWFDYDRDGYLDLVVCNYVQFSFAGIPPRCEYGNVRTYCEQRGYVGMPLTLYHNNRNGTFTDVSKASGLDQFVGRALGVVAIDVTGDGWPDLFITRDGSPNLLLLNQRNGTFVDAALAAEVAFDGAGNAKAGMGVDAGDANSDGHPDFVATNFNYEFHSLFLNRGNFPFEDATRSSRLAALTRSRVGWGAHFLDYDNDGLLDLLIVNGHINEVIETAQPEMKYKEQPLLLHNSGNAVFTDVSSAAGPAFSRGYLARGLAIGDWDNDGAADAIFTCIGDRPVLLRNNVGRSNSWIGIRLVGTKSNRDAMGAKLTLETGNRRLTRWVTGGSSYLSSHDRRVLFGLGRAKADSQVDVAIEWPSGASTTARSLEINRYHQIVEESKTK
ncbi:MAG TPA: CRTAC1 family protein [Candidatus Saccharimonadales bacterium]|nr:CRTAC1 family protein [Candidatus Saccharimonadales bacterium]